jgi:hypothetical protein
MPGLINAVSMLLGLFFSIKGISSFNLMHTKNGNHVGNHRAEGAMALKDKGDSIGDDSLNEFKPSMDWMEQCVTGLDPTAREKSNIRRMSMRTLTTLPPPPGESLNTKNYKYVDKTKLLARIMTRDPGVTPGTSLSIVMI